MLAVRGRSSVFVRALADRRRRGGRAVGLRRDTAHRARGDKVSTPQEKSPPKGTYKIGDPYQIGSAWYYPSVNYDYDETGIASWYGAKFHGRPTANGEIYDMNGLSAAHRTLPLPSIVRVTNLDNGRSLVLRVNDRGPFARGRIVDASRRSAQLLGFERAGTAKVRVQILARESRVLAARLNGEVTLADVGTPITVARLPKAPVTSQALEPVPGASPPNSSWAVKALKAAPAAMAASTRVWASRLWRR